MSLIPVILVAFLTSSGALDALKLRLSESLGLTLLAALGFCLNYVRPIRTYSSSLDQWLRRRLYIGLTGRYSPTVRKYWGWLTEILIRLPLRRMQLTHLTQEKAVKGVIDSLRTGVLRPLFLIEGASGAGKTSLVPLLMDAIIRSPQLAPLARKVFYFDFGAEEELQDRFLSEYSTLRFEGSLVVVDNFHRLSPSRLRQFTRSVVDCQKGCMERALIVLTQPLARMLTGPEGNIRLLVQVRASGRYIHLAKPSVDDFIDGLTEATRHRLSALAAGRSVAESIVNLHYARLLTLARSRHDAPVEEVLRIEERASLPSVSSTPLDDDLLEILGMITGLSMHRGLFSKEDFRRACFRLGGSWAITRWLFYFRCLRLLRRLTRSGFVLTALMSHRIFVFHELLAIHYKERYQDVPLFEHAFRTSMSGLMERTTSNTSPVLRWLYAVELLDLNSIHRGFGAALLHGSFLSLLTALERNVNSVHRDEFSYELGLLCEKVGRFSEARELLSNAINAMPDEDRARRAQILLIEAEHGPDASSVVGRLSRVSDSRLTTLLAEYWSIHLDAHLGIFRLPELIEVGDEVCVARDVVLGDDPYLALHLARRIYFDMFRFYYLIGTRREASWRSLKDHALCQLLKTRHPEFTAFETKFVKAHRVHYDLLFEVGALCRIPEENEVASSEGVAVSNLGELVRVAGDLYAKAIEEFDIFGDKTVGYIYSRQADVEMAREECDWRSVRLKLARYESFLGLARFDDMEGFLCAYFGKFHILRAFHSLAASSTANPAGEEFDSEILQAQAALAKGRRIHSAHQNRYGELRCEPSSLVF